MSSKSSPKFHVLEKSECSAHTNTIHGTLRAGSSGAALSLASTPTTPLTSPPLPRSILCFHSGGDGSQGRGRQQLLEETDEQHPENVHFHGGPGIVSTTAALQSELPRDTGFPAQGSDSLPPGTGQRHREWSPSEPGHDAEVRRGCPRAAAPLLLVL